MAETDRDRLQRLTRENREAKEARAERERLQREEEEGRRREELGADERKVDEALEVCKAVFDGQELQDGHVLQVDAWDTDPFLRRDRREQASTARAPWVVFFTAYRGPDCDYPQLPLLAVSFRGGNYECRDGQSHGVMEFQSLANLKEYLIQEVAGMDHGYIGEALRAEKRRGY